MNNTSLTINALVIATHVHKNQTRANGVEPYICHPLRVADIVENIFPHYAYEEVIASAILHDTLEECELYRQSSLYEKIYKDCGQKVAGYVDLLTKPRKTINFKLEKYFARLAISPKEVIIIKLADRIDNLRSLSNCNWKLKKVLSYIQQSIDLKEIADNRGMIAESNQLLTEIMLCESYINSFFL